MTIPNATCVMKKIIGLLLVYHTFILLETLIILFRSGHLCFSREEHKTAL